MLLFLVVGIGCTTPPETLALIEHSERVAIDYPDSALMLIESVDRVNIRGKRDMAHYRLAYSEALYHNQIDSDCDSLTRPLFDYYYDSDLHAERARAMYQHGLVMMNAKKNAEAMYALLEAEKSLQHCDNPRLLGLVYRTMGDIYGSECLHTNALSLYHESFEIFDNLHLNLHLIHILHNIGESLYSIGDYESAQEYLIRAKDLAIADGQNQLLSLIIYSLCDVYLYCDKIDKLGETVMLFNQYSCPIYYESDYYYYQAIYKASIGSKQEALNLMAIADSIPKKTDTSVEQLKNILYRYLGDKTNELYWLYAYKVQQEELLLSVLELPILNTQIDLLKRDIDIARERAQYVKYRNIFVFLLLLIIAITIALYIRHRMIMQRHEIEKYVSMISELKLNYENSSSVILSEVQAVYGKKLSDLNNLLETYYEHGNTSRESYKIVEQVKSIVESIRRDGESMLQLERLVNLHHNNIVVSIKSSGIRFSDKELRYIIYVLSGLSNRSMCLLLDIDDAALYRIKYKVKNKMIEAGLDNEIIKMLLRR